MPYPVFRGFGAKLGRRVGDRTRILVLIDNVQEEALVEVAGELNGIQYRWSGIVNPLGNSGRTRVTLFCIAGDPQNLVPKAPGTSDDIIDVVVTVTNDPDGENPTSSSMPGVPVELVP
jgi:hypothetical protein